MFSFLLEFFKEKAKCPVCGTPNINKGKLIECKKCNKQYYRKY